MTKIEQILELLKDYEYTPATMTPNLFKMKNNKLSINRDTAKWFNQVLDLLDSIDDIYKIEWTKSGGIKRSNSFIPYGYGLKFFGKTTPVLVVMLEDRFYRFTLGIVKANDKDISGYASFKAFYKECEDFGIKLEEYTISKEKGQKIKENFPSPQRKLFHESFANKVWENVHHIDLHSAFMSGLIAKNPEFTRPVTSIYNKRKSNDKIYKAILTHTYGYMQSSACSYKYAHLSKDMVDWTNETLNSLCDKLWETGRIVLAINTDGIWYQGDIYKDENCGNGLMKYENDYTNCKIRFASCNKYEFIDSNNKLHVVASGILSYEKIKPRDQFEWGDIYKSDVECWHWYNNRIIYKEGENHE